MSWKVQVIADTSKKWIDNHLRFSERREAEEYAWLLAMRWLLVREWRVVWSEDPVNFLYKETVETT